MKLKIELEMDNAAFDRKDKDVPSPKERDSDEVKRILNLLCARNGYFCAGDKGELRDWNGHKVGKWSVR